MDGDINGYTTLFSKKFKEVCTSILGRHAVNRIEGEYKDLRNFFEQSSPTTQCNNTVGGFEEGTSRCWICGKQINRGEQDCEHKLPVILALAFTGLYDSQLFMALSKDRRDAYVVALRDEYAWSHQRCNRKKSEHRYLIDPTTQGDPSARVTLIPNESLIGTDLTFIFTGELNGNLPSPNELRSREPAYQDGVTIPDRNVKIATELGPIQTKYSGLYTQGQVYSRFKYGILTRARLFDMLPLKPTKRMIPTGRNPPGPALANHLRPQMLTGGRRTTTIRSRKVHTKTRRIQRGGVGEVDWEDALYEATEDIVRNLKWIELIAYETWRSTEAHDGGGGGQPNALITARAERFDAKTGPDFVGRMDAIAHAAIDDALSWTYGAGFDDDVLNRFDDVLLGYIFDALDEERGKETLEDQFKTLFTPGATVDEKLAVYTSVLREVLTRQNAAFSGFSESLGKANGMLDVGPAAAAPPSPPRLARDAMGIPVSRPGITSSSDLAQTNAAAAGPAAAAAAAAAADTAPFDPEEDKVVQTLRDIGADLGLRDDETEMGIRQVVRKSREDRNRFYNSRNRALAFPFMNEFIAAVHLEEDPIPEKSIEVSLEEYTRELKKSLQSSSSRDPSLEPADPSVYQTLQGDVATLDPANPTPPRRRTRREPISPRLQVARQLYSQKMSRLNSSESSSRSRSRSRSPVSRGGGFGPKPDWF